MALDETKLNLMFSCGACVLGRNVLKTSTFKMKMFQTEIVVDLIANNDLFRNYTCDII